MTLAERVPEAEVSTPVAGQVLAGVESSAAGPVVGGTASSPWAENADDALVADPAADTSSFDEGVMCDRGCGRVHQPRERSVRCRLCGSATDDVHGICGSCWLSGAAVEMGADSS